MIYTDDGPTLYDCVHLYGHDFGEELGQYPIFDETMREWLNGRIFDHFKYREIASDTPALFFDNMQRLMHESMPQVNPLFSLMGTDGKDVDAGSGHETRSTSSTTANTDAKQLFSATPQTQLSGAESYATNITEAKNDTGSESNSISTGRSASIAAMSQDWAINSVAPLNVLFAMLEPCFCYIID